MPVYDYKCREHGQFSDVATMEDFDKPKPCPVCQTLCARVIVIPPEILELSPMMRHAHETNERNQHEPTVSTKDRRENDEEHRHGCGCHQSKSKSKLMYTAEGDKMFPSMRPWMISH